MALLQILGVAIGLQPHPAWVVGSLTCGRSPPQLCEIAARGEAWNLCQPNICMPATGTHQIVKKLGLSSYTDAPGLADATPIAMISPSTPSILSFDRARSGF
jgi:hypothetical protein